MPSDLEEPPRGYTTSDVETQSASVPSRRRSRFKAILALVVIAPIVLFVLYTWMSLTYTYSQGERAGYIQKFSRKGWLCKTWEGEIAMTTVPGVAPELFRFTVRDDRVAQHTLENMGKRVSITYDQHVGVPTSCFGETEYYVTNISVTSP